MRFFITIVVVVLIGALECFTGEWMNGLMLIGLAIAFYASID